MGEGATIQFILFEQFGFGFKLYKFASVWSFDIAIVFFAVCINFTRRKEKNTKFFEFVNERRRRR